MSASGDGSAIPLAQWQALGFDTHSQNDLDGTPRPLGTAFDIGAYEFVPISGNTDLTGASIELYPNPTSDYVTITGELTRFNLQVIDINGRVVLHRTGESAPLTVSLKDLPPGSYFLLMENERNQLLGLKKVVKE